MLAQHGDAEQFGAVLDGLAAFEAHREIVTLLDRLVTLLKGDQRNRTIFLLERKQQALDLERIAELFRESQSPYQIQKALGQGLCTAAYLVRATNRASLTSWSGCSARSWSTRRRSGLSSWTCLGDRSSWSMKTWS